MNNVILSAKYPIFAEKLKQRGYHVIYSETLPDLIPYEQDHADMQCLILDDTAFVLKECTRLADELRSFYCVIPTEGEIRRKYPHNVLLNAAVVGKNVITKTDSLDRIVREYCENHGYRLIHVKQGYAKCSCAVVSDNAIITADNGIYNSLEEYKTEVLKIRQGRVALEGEPYGFIGGASGLDVCSGERILYFAGKIELHPDCREIKHFCEKHHTKVVSLTDGELTDIGGMLFC